MRLTRVSHRTRIVLTSMLALLFFSIKETHAISSAEYNASFSNCTIHENYSAQSIEYTIFIKNYNVYINSVDLYLTGYVDTGSIYIQFTDTNFVDQGTSTSVSFISGNTYRAYFPSSVKLTNNNFYLMNFIFYSDTDICKKTVSFPFETTYIDMTKNSLGVNYHVGISKIDFYYNQQSIIAIPSDQFLNYWNFQTQLIIFISAIITFLIAFILILKLVL